jgi:hypothetical protein
MPLDIKPVQHRKEKCQVRPTWRSGPCANAACDSPFFLTPSFRMIAKEAWTTLLPIVDRILSTSSVDQTEFMTCYSTVFDTTTEEKSELLLLLNERIRLYVNCAFSHDTTQFTSFLHAARILNHCFRHLCSSTPGIFRKAKTEAVYQLCIEIWNEKRCRCPYGRSNEPTELSKIVQGIAEVNL